MVQRFSLRLLLLLTAISAVALAYATSPSPQQRIRFILSSSIPDAEKLLFVSKYLKLGDQESVINERIGPPSSYLGGSVQHDCVYADYTLVLSYRSDGTLFRIGYIADHNGPMPPVFRELDALPLEP
ncbi:MAG: hypothetical protein J0M26_02280 [Planctomycetes bacterium]|nr:hypothetical protein [Planctomycetota bacterium]